MNLRNIPFQKLLQMLRDTEGRFLATSGILWKEIDYRLSLAERIANHTGKILKKGKRLNAT